MKDVKHLKTLEEIRAISDPYRYKILNCFYKIGEPITVKQLADELGEVPAKVHYHVKKMEKAGLLTLVHTKEINGIIAKYYEPTARHFRIEGEETEGMNEALKLGESQKLVSQIFDDSKRTFLEQMYVREKKDKGKNTSINVVNTENIFLTEEEAQELVEYINDFIDKKRKRPEEEANNINEYQCFFSIIKMRDK